MIFEIAVVEPTMMRRNEGLNINQIMIKEGVKMRLEKSLVNIFVIFILLLFTVKGFSQPGPDYLYGKQVEFSKYIKSIKCKNVAFNRIRTNRYIIKYKFDDSVECQIAEYPNKSRECKSNCVKPFPMCPFGACPEWTHGK